MFFSLEKPLQRHRSLQQNGIYTTMMTQRLLPQRCLRLAAAAVTVSQGDLAKRSWALSVKTCHWLKGWQPRAVERTEWSTWAAKGLLTPRTPNKWWREHEEMWRTWKTNAGGWRKLQPPSQQQHVSETRFSHDRRGNSIFELSWSSDLNHVNTGLHQYNHHTESTHLLVWSVGIMYLALVCKYAGLYLFPRRNLVLYEHFFWYTTCYYNKKWKTERNI